jgi:hypothetical protein
MIKRLKILVSILPLSLIAFSQTDTTITNKGLTKSTDSVLCLPLNVARQIAVDLIKYDECVEIVATQTEHIHLLEKRSIVQDSIIQEQKTQYTACREQTTVLTKKVEIYDESNRTLTEQNRKLKNKNTALGLLTGIAVSVAVTLSIIK